MDDLRSAFGWRILRVPGVRERATPWKRTSPGPAPLRAESQGGQIYVNKQLGIRFEGGVTQRECSATSCRSSVSRGIDTGTNVRDGTGILVARCCRIPSNFCPMCQTASGIKDRSCVW
jgi:hypothetical protein